MQEDKTEKNTRKPNFPSKYLSLLSSSLLLSSCSGQKKLEHEKKYFLEKISLYFSIIIFCLQLGCKSFVKDLIILLIFPHFSDAFEKRDPGQQGTIRVNRAEVKNNLIYIKKLIYILKIPLLFHNNNIFFAVAPSSAFMLKWIIYIEFNGTPSPGLALVINFSCESDVMKPSTDLILSTLWTLIWK